MSALNRKKPTLTTIAKRLATLEHAHKAALCRISKLETGKAPLAWTQGGKP